MIMMVVMMIMIIMMIMLVIRMLIMNQIRRRGRAKKKEICLDPAWISTLAESQCFS